MQVSTKFTIALHILAATEYFGKDQKITSELLASSIGSNPVIIRNIMGSLRNAGLIEIKRGPGGITISRPLDQITFYDVYEAVETNKDTLFHFHDDLNPNCPVARNMHGALDGKLTEIQRQFGEDLKRFTVGDVVRDLYRNIEGEKKIS
ncbi:Rrf2 family transcriptional regulator [Chordicoccus furentiruminis]|jgi:DNA-binding IscR family transcriptional regulator|uniref:Rrf2 family transcriptional regulator n=1 Tax=Chordicoccus furentiruminis TaxID=2709410 RepID=UPI0023A84A2A|nr:Rrf2 family transcriptional regulator [Chordicoccus furentiruminis]